MNKLEKIQKSMKNKEHVRYAPLIWVRRVRYLLDWINRAVVLLKGHCTEPECTARRQAFFAEVEES